MLVMSGGQFYWPDEDRYRQSRDMVEAAVAGDTQAVWNRAMASGHPLFKVLGMLPAAVEWKYGRDPRIPRASGALVQEQRRLSQAQAAERRMWRPLVRA